MLDSAPLHSHECATGELSVSRPTNQCYEPLDRAYTYFNEALFGGRLPGALITLRADRRSLSYFSPARFGSKARSADEIALNPVMFGLWPAKGVLSLLVHEMCHQAMRKAAEVKPSSIKPTYHSREMADQMLAIGLCPSSTGAPGGKMTGECIGHYVIAGGNFDLAADALIDEGFELVWHDRLIPEELRSHPGLVIALLEQRPTAPVESVSEIPPIADSPQAEPTVGRCVPPDEEAEIASFGIPMTSIPARASRPPTITSSEPAPVQVTDLPILSSYDIGRLRKSLKDPEALVTSLESNATPADAIEPRAKSVGKSKVAYDCPSCSATLWGKSGLSVFCGCSEPKPQFIIRTIDPQS